MKIDRIKELFYMKETNYPFPSNELYMFFGFNRHNNFIRILKNDKYSSEITIKPWSKINYRSSIVYYVTRNLFYILCQKYIKDYTAITDVYFEYKQSSLKSKILNFNNHSKKEYIFRLNVYEKIKGFYYTYSLNTLNIAKDLDIDIYDLYKFCSLNFCPKYKYGSAKCTNENRNSYEASYPYYSYDNLYHNNRLVFLELLKIIKEKYDLSDFQKKIITVYIELIKQMLDKQYEYDIKEHRNTNDKKWIKYSFSFKPILTKEQQTEIKCIYRKAAMLCHPDKNMNGEETFKELNIANNNNDLQKVIDIYNRLLNN